jgi:transposase-like protein
VISSNPSDEATSESEPESSAQSVPESVGVDPAPRPTRRSFTAAYKARIVAEYEGAPHGAKSAVLRRERLFHSHIKEWASARDAGALSGLTDARTSAKRPHKSAPPGENARLRAENTRLAAQLTQTRTALDIMGKVHALLETLSESADNPTSSPKS